MGQPLTLPQGRPSLEMGARLNPGESRSSRYRFVAGELDLAEVVAVSPSAQGNGESHSRRLTPSVNEAAALRRRVSDDGFVRLVASMALRDVIAPSDPRHGRSFTFQGAHEIAMQTKNGETYTVESLAITDAAGPAATVLLFKRAGRMVSAKKITQPRRDRPATASTILTVMFRADGALGDVTFTETGTGSSQVQDVSAVHAPSNVIHVLYTANTLACENEVLAFDAAMGVLLAYQIEMALVAASCGTTLWACAAWVAMQENGILLDIALTLAIQARNNCMHQLTNDRSGGSVGPDGKFCYYIYYLETWDGGQHWETVDVQERCEPVYEI